MQTNQEITIAIDGYSSCGKSTLAKALAKELNYVFIDSGAMYRCVALFAIEQEYVRPNGSFDSEKLIAHLPAITITFGKPNEEGTRSVHLNGKDVSKEIRQLHVAQIVSEIAAIKEVRSYLVKQQQQLGINGGVIMDGRDIGTVVFPNAELKLFITANPDIRAQRRYKELTEKGENYTLEEIKENLLHRDKLDTTRKESPLIQAQDAIVIDNSNLTPNEQLNLALEYVRNAREINNSSQTKC